jgi:hypothetical protein
VVCLVLEKRENPHRPTPTAETLALLARGSSMEHAVFRVAVRLVLGLGLGVFLAVCGSDDEPYLRPVEGCVSTDECVEADERFDSCMWVCSGQTTYCRASCETDDDCKGRGLPSDYIFCDSPRPGEGFCNQFGHDYSPSGCDQTVTPID